MAPSGRRTASATSGIPATTTSRPTSAKRPSHGSSAGCADPEADGVQSAWMGKLTRVAAGAMLALLLGAAPRKQQQPDLGISVFPSSNPWNWDITGLGVHPGSAAYISTIGASTPIREDYSF